MKNTKGIVFNIERYTLHDGPGIRTTVYLKGCPLNCIWCSNPESQSRTPEIAFFTEKCTGCGQCLPLCPHKAIRQDEEDEPISILFDRCQGCGDCVNECYPEAIVLMGEDMAASEVIEIIERDKKFYDNSGGGVTLSGGEPLAQIAFSVEILHQCKTLGIHTAIQTCGYASRPELDKVLPYIDLIIFDLKHMNDEQHQRLTGVGNRKIIENLKYIDSKNSRIIVQITLIPRYNDSEDNLREIFSLIKTLKSVEGVSLLAYHSLGASKYRRMGRSYLLSELNTPPKDYLENKMRWVKQFNVPLIRFNG